MAQIPLLKLNNGLEMPGLGFGTFAKEGIPGRTHAAVLAALEAGYRHLDCAWYYGNEDEVGAALREWLGRHPAASRQDIFITTKVWPHLMEPADIEWSLDNSLHKLGTEYVDCFLLHWPLAAEKTEDNQVKLGPDGKYIIKTALTQNLTPCWRTLEALYAAGKTRSIGVSNWSVAGLEALLRSAVVPPSVNQVELHPFLPSEALVAFCRARDILPVAYSPLGSQGQVPFTGETLATNAALGALAARKGVELAQLLIAWGLRRGCAVLPKSAREERIRSNFALVELSDDEFEAVNRVAEGRAQRFVDLKATFGYEVWPEEG